MIPIVNGIESFDQERLDKPMPNPAAIMSAPNGPGARAVATTPATT